MENASKALIIAGAILLSILIIAIGIFIYQSASSTINDSLNSMNTQQVQAFNSQFSNYQGENVTGTEVKALLSVVIGNAATYIDEPGKVLTVNASNFSNSRGVNVGTLDNADFHDAGAGNEDAMNDYMNAVTNIQNNVVTRHRYSVTFTAAASGAYSGVTISDLTGSGS